MSARPFSPPSLDPARSPVSGAQGRESVLQGALDFSAPYFNTTSLTGEALTERRRAAAAQEAAVMGVFTTHGNLGPWQVQERLQARGHDWPITSIRRAITGLTKRNLLVKTVHWHVGPHGMREHVWALPERGVAA